MFSRRAACKRPQPDHGRRSHREQAGRHLPVRHQQLVLVHVMPRDLARVQSRSRCAATTRRSASPHALDATCLRRPPNRPALGARTTPNRSPRRRCRILLGLQHTPGGVITASEIDVLRQLRMPVRTVTELLDEVGMFRNDITPAVERWFTAHISHLPTAVP